MPLSSSLVGISESGTSFVYFGLMSTYRNYDLPFHCRAGAEATNWQDTRQRERFPENAG